METKQMSAKQTARIVALNSILEIASKEGFESLTESEWTDIVTLAWDSQSVIDDEGRREHRENLRRILEQAVTRNVGANREI
jgi:hypothetical protein